MLGSSKLTALLGSAPRADADNAILKAYAKTLQTDAGLALFLVVPGGKQPADCRTTQARNKAIKEAAEAGEPKPTGLHMATHNATHLGRWIDKYRKDRDPDTPVNMAMEVGRSRLVVIDVDTVAELDAFRQTWAERSGDPALAWVAPTVSSPGVQDPDTGEWVHRGGGHFYLRLPEGLELPPETPSTLTYGEAGAQWVARIKDAYVLIPPSQRKEGTYWVSGTDHAIPDWLMADILGNAEARGQRRAERAERAAKAAASGDVDEITAWTQATPWDDILEAAGWTPAGRADGCTCDIWTRPGNNPSPKSATAHNSGCSDPRMNPDSPPIHIWSDNVEGGLADWVAAHGKTLSKLQFIAAVHHGGDIVKAMESVGITPEGENSSDGSAMSESDLRDLGARPSSELDAELAAPIKDRTKPKASEPPVEVDHLNLSPAGAEETPRTPGAKDSETPSSDDAEDPDDNADDDAPYRPVFAAFNHWRNLPPPEYIVEGWVEDRALSAVIGPPGAGKSAVVLDMACSIAMGVPWQGKPTKRNRVLYIAGEGGTGAAMRVKAWEQEHNLDVGEDLFMITEAVLVGAGADLWGWLADNVVENDIHLVIFDTLARMSLGLEENSSTDMGKAVSRFDRLRKEADTGVMVVHHTARGQTHGRGSTAILGALDSEVLVMPPDDDDDEDGDQGRTPGPKRLTATVTKQKNAADGESVDLTLCERHGSIVVADASGATGDPFAAPVLEFVRPAPETDTELAVRLAEYLEPLPMQGATVTDMARDVVPSKAYRNNPSAWRAAVLRAKDRGLATALIQTFGPDGSQRFIKGTATPSQAYALDRAEADDKEVTG